MLKIYNAYANHGEIKVDDFITFENGRFNTGYNGFGEVHAGDLSCKKANYSLQSLKAFREELERIKTVDGWVQNFVLWRPMSYKSLAEKYKYIERTEEAYENAGLNEEGILLFTDYISLIAKDSSLCQRIFGRCPDTGLYLLMPNASVSMSIIRPSDEQQEDYEVLQSQSLGRQLSLTKMNRKI